MRNEEFNARSKILRVIEEIGNRESVKIIVIDSDSRDETSDIASKTLGESKFPEKNWQLFHAEKPGKSHAINLALSKIKSDFFVIMDTDSVAESGWLSRIIGPFADSEVGVVSGMEKAVLPSPNSHRGAYRAASDKIRIFESSLDSTMVTEGSLFSWRSSALGDFTLNESINGDDAQITFAVIRNGFRSIVAPELFFIDENPSKNWSRRSIRRSQGLSRVIIRNIDLIFVAPRTKARIYILHSFLLYIIFPWAMAILISTQIATLILSNGSSMTGPLAALTLLPLILLKSGRSAVWGSLISIIAHLQILLGRTYEYWDPERPVGRKN